MSDKALEKESNQDAKKDEEDEKEEENKGEEEIIYKNLSAEYYNVAEAYFDLKNKKKDEQ